MYAVTVEYFFKVRDAEMWGGLGSVGYCNNEFGGIYPLANTHEEFEACAENCRLMMAKELGVDPSQVDLISEEEYDLAAAEDDDEDDAYDDDEADYDGPHRH